jgi:SAM-dependent methyltransferase
VPAADGGVAPAGYYEEYYAERKWRFYSWLLAQVVERSVPGPILDVGAGPGLFTEAAGQWGFECVGLEGSAEGVAMATARCPWLDIRHHLLSEPMPLEGATFNTVLINQVIEHLEPTVASIAVAESFRVLKPGGTLMVMSPSKFNKYEAEADPTHINLMTPGELEALVRSKGFVEVEALNSPLPLLGGSRIARWVVTAIYELTRWERLSATANCIARKPEAPSPA